VRFSRRSQSSENSGFMVQRFHKEITLGQKCGDTVTCGMVQWLKDFNCRMSQKKQRLI
jgi:hypothetical protein